MAISQLRSMLSFSFTGADTAAPLTQADVPCYEVNIHAYTHPAYYGDGAVMGAEIAAGDVATFKKCNLKDIFIQNKNAGDNTVVYIVAAVPNHFVTAALGL